jgi:predicted Zn-dependent protease
VREDLESRFREALPAVEFATLRYVEEREEQLAVRRGVVQPVESSLDAGAMLTVIDGGGIGYAATPDLSVAGLRRAAEQARTWAVRTAG